MALADPTKTKITHVLRDGTVLDSIEGHVVRFEDAEPLYRMMYDMSRGIHIGEPRRRNERGL